MRVVISGAGAVGRHLASDLANRGHAVTLIEQDPDVLETAKEWAPDVDHLLGDACEPWVLEKAQLNTADVVVAATGDDEDNLVTSLLAKQEYGVPRVLARVNHPDNEWLFTEQWGVDAAVSPPHILTAMVEEEVTVGRPGAPAAARARRDLDRRADDPRRLADRRAGRCTSCVCRPTPRSWRSSGRSTS